MLHFLGRKYSLLYREMRPLNCLFQMWDSRDVDDVTPVYCVTSDRLICVLSFLGDIRHACDMTWAPASAYYSHAWTSGESCLGLVCWVVALWALVGHRQPTITSIGPPQACGKAGVVYFLLGSNHFLKQSGPVLFGFFWMGLTDIWYQQNA